MKTRTELLLLKGGALRPGQRCTPVPGHHPDTGGMDTSGHQSFHALPGQEPGSPCLCEAKARALCFFRISAKEQSKLLLLSSDMIFDLKSESTQVKTNVTAWMPGHLSQIHGDTMKAGQGEALVLDGPDFNFNSGSSSTSGEGRW